MCFIWQLAQEGNPGCCAGTYEGGGNLLRLGKTTSNYSDAGGLESQFLWTLDTSGMITHIYIGGLR